MLVGRGRRALIGRRSAALVEPRLFEAELDDVDDEYDESETGGPLMAEESGNLYPLVRKTRKVADTEL
jgi:hypothetical protein